MPNDKNNSKQADDLAGQFAILMMKNRDAIYRYLYSLHPIPDEIDDLLQDTALTLWKKIDDYDQSRNFLPWALRFAYFEVLSWRKHMSKRRFILSEDMVLQLSEKIDPVDELKEARLKALKDCMSKLSKRQIKIVEQRYSNKGSLKDLAGNLGISTHKVYHYLDNARDALVCCIQKKLTQKGMMK